MKEIGHLLHEFSEAAMAIVEAQHSGKYAQNNRKVRKIEVLFNQIVDLGDEGRERLAELTLDNHDAVRLYAAMYSLHYCPEKSVVALRSLAKSHSKLRANAESVLGFWLSEAWTIGSANSAVVEKQAISKLAGLPPQKIINQSVSGSLDDLTKCPPLNVKLADIGDQKRIHERVSFANLCCDDCINYEGPDLTFSPDEPFPPKDHILAWVWSIRPDLGSEIVGVAGPKLSQFICEYIEAADLYE